MIRFAVEIVGLLLTGIARPRRMAKLACSAGAGFSLVFPALGCGGGEPCRRRIRARWQLARCLRDMSLALPAAGRPVMARAGVPVIYPGCGSGGDGPDAHVAAVRPRCRHWRLRHHPDVLLNHDGVDDVFSGSAFADLPLAVGDLGGVSSLLSTYPAPRKSKLSDLFAEIMLSSSKACGLSVRWTCSSPPAAACIGRAALLIFHRRV